MARQAARGTKVSGQGAAAAFVPDNHFRKVYSVINLSVLDNFEAGSVVDIDALAEKGLIKLIKNSVGLKVLAGGAVNKALTVKAAAFSASAKEAIEKAGGTAEII